MYLISLSPKYNRNRSATFLIVLFNKGYKVESISSSKFCSSTMLPFATLNSIVFKKLSDWGSKITNLSLFYFSIYRIHLFPWSCGSIIKGNILPFLTSTPFSLLNWSSGRPFNPHFMNSTGFTKNSGKL